MKQRVFESQVAGLIVAVTRLTFYLRSNRLLCSLKENYFLWMSINTYPDKYKKTVYFNYKSILVWRGEVFYTNTDWYRPLGRPRRRWGDNIKMDLQEVGGGWEDWMELAQHRDRWRALVSTVMNLRVPKMRGISWLAAKPVSFSRRTLPHGVSKSKYWLIFEDCFLLGNNATPLCRRISMFRSNAMSSSSKV